MTFSAGVEKGSLAESVNLINVNAKLNQSLSQSESSVPRHVKKTSLSNLVDERDFTALCRQPLCHFESFDLVRTGYSEENSILTTFCINLILDIEPNSVFHSLNCVYVTLCHGREEVICNSRVHIQLLLHEVRWQAT